MRTRMSALARRFSKAAALPSARPDREPNVRTRTSRPGSGPAENHPKRSSDWAAGMTAPDLARKGPRCANVRCYDRQRHRPPHPSDHAAGAPGPSPMTKKATISGAGNVSSLRDDERFVITSIAAALGGEWRSGENPPDAYLTSDTKTVAVEISTLTQPITDSRGTRSRLSDDRTARAFLDELDAELRNDVPTGCTIGLVLRPPIVRSRRTRNRLSETIRDLLADPTSFVSDREFQINGNDITVHRMQHGEVHPRRVSGIYLHRSSNPDVLANAKLILEGRITAKSKSCDQLRNRSLWLALLNDYWLANAHTYRIAMSSLLARHPFEKILLVNLSGSVDQLYPLAVNADGIASLYSA